MGLNGNVVIRKFCLWKVGNSSRCCDFRPLPVDKVFGDIPLFLRWEGSRNRNKSEDLPMKFDFADCGEQDADQTCCTFLNNVCCKIKKTLLNPAAENSITFKISVVINCRL